MGALGAAFDGGEQSLIPGLPDHLVAHRILSKISWWDFNSGLQVSRGWRSAIRESNSIRPRCRSSRPSLLGCIHPASSKKPSRPTPSFAISLLSPGNSPAWETLPPVPGLSCGAPLSGRCISVDNKLYVIGGRDPRSWEFLADVFLLDLAVTPRTWKRCSPMSTPRSAFACVSAGGRIFVAGGQGDEILTLSTAEVYDPSRDAWEPLPDLNVPRTECNGAVIGDRICILGGYSSSCEQSPTCELDDEQEPVTFWVSSADTIHMGSGSWETVDRIESEAIREPTWEIGSGILHSVHRSVVQDLSRRCIGNESWSVIDGKVVCSGASENQNGGETEVMFLATACGTEEVYASSCSVESSASASGKVKVSLCRAVNGDDSPKVVKWERMSCPFELSRYGASCFLV